MTQPFTPGEMAAVDHAMVKANQFIDSMLTDGVSHLQCNKPQYDLVVWYGGSLALNEDLNETHLRVLLATAVGKLAVLHHEIEQLADQWDAIAEKYIGESRNAVRLVSAELRKLVDP